MYFVSILIKLSTIRRINHVEKFRNDVLANRFQFCKKEMSADDPECYDYEPIYG